MIGEKHMVYNQTLSIVKVGEAVIYNVLLTIYFIAITMLII